MPKYTYHAYDGHGVKCTDSIECESISIASSRLKSLGLTVIKLDVQTAEKKAASTIVRALTLLELEVMTSELALLLESGVRIDKGLDILAKGSSGNTASILLKLASEVRKGETLSSAMNEIKGFDSVYLNLVRMGEESGNLALVFSQLAKELKFQCELRAKIIQSLTYPLVILFVCISCILFVFNFIVPRMSGLFEQASELPVYTEMLLGFSAWMQNYQLYLFVGVCIAIAGIVHLSKSGNLKSAISQLLYATPGLRSSVLLVNRIQISSSMAMLLSSGVTLDRALKMVVDGISLERLKSSVAGARSKVNNGESLTGSLSSTGVYSDIALSLIEVGEESGELSRVFEEVAQRSRREFEAWTSKLTSILEPLMILVMGGIVGGVVVVMLLSITSLNDVAL